MKLLNRKAPEVEAAPSTIPESVRLPASYARGYFTRRAEIVARVEDLTEKIAKLDGEAHSLLATSNGHVEDLAENLSRVSAQTESLNVFKDQAEARLKEVDCDFEKAAVNLVCAIQRAREACLDSIHAMLREKIGHFFGAFEAMNYAERETTERTLADIFAKSVFAKDEKTLHFPLLAFSDTGRSPKLFLNLVEPYLRELELCESRLTMISEIRAGRREISRDFAKSDHPHLEKFRLKQSLDQHHETPLSIAALKQKYDAALRSYEKHAAMAKNLGGTSEEVYGVHHPRAYPEFSRLALIN
jgi:hypothetical protein